MHVKNTLLIGLLVYWIIGLFSPQASASSMGNDNYTLEKRTVNIQPFTTPSPTPVQQKHKAFASGTNYTVETTAPEVFSVNLSQDRIDFGQLSATNPVIRKIALTVASGNPYHILAGEDHPLQSPTKAIIPDTTCDNGSCSELTEALWTNTLTYGFGYRTDDLAASFFKQFPDLSRHEALQPIARGNKTRTYPLTYKVTISGTQESGSYTNMVTFIAIPDF